MHSAEAERVGQIEEPGLEEVALPVVIRPNRLLFGDVEARLRQDRRFAACLGELPPACAAVARAVMLRDGGARRRFASLGELADYLHALAARYSDGPVPGPGLAS